MSTPWSWSGGGRRQADEVRWGRKVTEMGWGADKDEKGKKGGHTMTSPPSYATMSWSSVALLQCRGQHEVVGVEGEEECGESGCWRWNSSTTARAWTSKWGSHMLSECDQPMNLTRYHNLLSQLAMGCVTCHACHGCVMDFRPILGNPMEVTHVTSLGHVYIFPC